MYMGMSKCMSLYLYICAFIGVCMFVTHFDSSVQLLHTVVTTMYMYIQAHTPAHTNVHKLQCTICT